MATIEIKLKSLRIPNFVKVDDGSDRTIPVSELPASAVQSLAADFLKDFYDKAGVSYDWRFD